MAKAGNEPCQRCGGEGRIQQEAMHEISYPAGVQNGWSQVFAGAGDEHDDPSLANGDFILTLRVEDHPFFRRVGSDVHTELPVSMVQATLGSKLRIPSLSGTTILVVPPGTQPGTQLTIEGEGFPIPLAASKGSMLVRLQISIPS